LTILIVDGDDEAFCLPLFPPGGFDRAGNTKAVGLSRRWNLSGSLKPDRPRVVVPSRLELVLYFGLFGLKRPIV
jgi:hypothetical protein